MNDTGSINLYELRLCFQVFLTGNGHNTPLDPVVSSPIYGKSNELTITMLCSCSSPMNGGAKIIMLCDKVNKGDIKIRFFETNDDDNVVWEAYADFQPSDVHKQCAIPFTAPRYRNPDCQQHVTVRLMHSNGCCTSTKEFFCALLGGGAIAASVGQCHKCAAGIYVLSKSRYANICSSAA